MLEAGTLCGARGLVKAAYLTAAEVTGYRLARDPLSGAWRVTGTIVASDPYLLAQPGLMFVAPHKGGAWRWTIDAHRVAGGTLVATLKGI